MPQDPISFSQNFWRFCVQTLGGAGLELWGVFLAVPPCRSRRGQGAGQGQAGHCHRCLVTAGEGSHELCVPQGELQL